MREAQVGIFGGSGFYDFFPPEKEIEINTPYGSPSDKIALFQLGGKKVAFLPRHGKKHHLPPHKIPYRANLWAMKELGVTQILAPCAVGSLQKEIRRGHLVLADQLVDRTKSRLDTFFEGPKVVHVSMAEPFCPDLSQRAYQVGQALGYPLHKGGTAVVIEGPRFSSKAESRWFTQMGWQVVNMTIYPECVLARELEICYLNLSLVTDYDTGLPEEAEPVSAAEVMRSFQDNVEKLKKLLERLIPQLPQKRECLCVSALSSAQL